MKSGQPCQDLQQYSRLCLLLAMEKHCWVVSQNCRKAYVKERLAHLHDPYFVAAKLVWWCYCGIGIDYQMEWSVQIEEGTLIAMDVVRALMCRAISEGMRIPFDPLVDKVATMMEDDFGHLAAHDALANYCHLPLVSRVGNILAELLLRPGDYFPHIKPLVRITKEIRRMNVSG